MIPDERALLGWVLLLDASVVLGAVIALRRFERGRLPNALLVLLGMHVAVVTYRLVALLGGAEFLFELFAGRLAPVTVVEIQRAALMADVTLIGLAMGWTAARVRTAAVPQRKPPRPLRAVVSARVAVVSGGLMIVAGGAATVLLASVPGLRPSAIAETEWSRSTWLAGAVNWIGLGTVLLWYRFGSRRWIAGLAFVNAALMTYQGFHRFRIVLPIVMMVFIARDRSRNRRLPAWATVALVATAITFPSLKSVGRGLQEGRGLLDTGTTMAEGIEQLQTGEHDHSKVLDMLASATTLADDNGHYFLGRTFSGLLTLPIPRPWWPEKPGLADYLMEISRPWRPMFEWGMVVTLPGEAYINFGWPGIVAIALALGWSLGRLTRMTETASQDSTGGLMMVMIASSLILVYRDGLTAFVIFTVIGMMPLVLTLVLVALRDWFRRDPTHGARRWPRTEGPGTVISVVRP